MAERAAAGIGEDFQDDHRHGFSNVVKAEIVVYLRFSPIENLSFGDAKGPLPMYASCATRRVDGNRGPATWTGNAQTTDVPQRAHTPVSLRRFADLNEAAGAADAASVCRSTRVQVPTNRLAQDSGRE